MLADTYKSKANLGLGMEDTRKPPIFSSKSSFEALPLEIREQIAQECLQSDAFHLCLVSRSLYESSVSRLYQCIVFDSTHRHFNKETSRLRRQPTLAPDLSERDQYFAFCSVQTVGGLRGCLRTLALCPSKAAMVKRLETYNSLEISDLDVKEKFAMVFPGLVNLQCLIWHGTPEITVDMLTKCEPTARNLSTLSLHMALRQNSVSKQITTLSLPNLKHLVLCPFRTSEYLSWCGVFFANSYTMETRSQLQTLYLGQNIANNQAVGSGFTFASMDKDNYLINGKNVKPIRAFFEPTLQKLQKEQKDQIEHHITNRPIFIGVKKLGLTGIVASGDDAELLESLIDLENLTHLSLVGSDEGDEDIFRYERLGPQYAPLPNETGDCMRYQAPGLISALSPRLQNLRHLEINWNSGKTAGVSRPTDNLLLQLKHLESLKLNLINYDRGCLYAIGKVPGLRRLTIQAMSGNIVVAMDSDWLSPLASCRSLQSLKIPCTEIPQWLEELDELEILHLEKPTAKPYLGHPFILSYKLEDFTRLGYRVQDAKQIQPSLKYVKLEGYVFDFNGKTPVWRQGLNQWLDDEIFPPWEL